MEKVYGALKWLNMAQALEYLELLTDKPITKDILIQFCIEKKVGAYVFIDIPGAEGKTSRTKEKVNLVGMQEVLNPHMAFRDGDQVCGVLKHGDEHWIGLLPRSIRTDQFKSADIEAIAAKMNGAVEQPSAGLEALRQQLEQERAAREASEAEVADLRLQLATAGQDSAGLTFPYATKALEAMRAAAAEFWQEHDRTKPAPYGIQKQVQNFLVSSTGENARKVAEWAAAIKPDDLPKA